MRIGFVIYGRLDTLTGGYLYDKILVDGLQQLGHEVEVISFPPGSYLKHLVSGFLPGSFRRIFKGRFDIVVQDELCHPSFFLLNRQRLQQNAPPLVVALVHHTLCHEPRRRWQNMLLAVAEKSFLASVDGFIYNSETTRSKVRSLIDHHLPELIAYPAGNRLGSPVSAEVVSNRAQRPGPLELVFLGNVIPRKGLLPLLGALAGVDREVWRLSVVGGFDFDPAHGVKVRQRCRHLDLSDSVRFLGILGDADLMDVLGSSHLLCMPYAYEGFGIAILEAMAFGLPAIGCRNGAAGETIHHGINGFLLASDDLSGLGPLLVGLHKDREQLQRMSHSASRTYAASPGWQDSVAAIDGFLREMKGVPYPEKKCFDSNYLAAKKTIDDQSLNRHVWERLHQALNRPPDGEPMNILEIGAGIGTMFQRMVDRGLLTGPVSYVATDSDQDQLRAARNYLCRWAQQRGHRLVWSGEWRADLHTSRAEISLKLERASAEDLASRAESLDTFHLVTAHAVLDLVDFPVVLPRILSRLAHKGMAYFTCNFDGETLFLPATEGDREIVSRYHASMEARLKGASCTGRRLLSFLQGPGLELLAAGSSDWVIHPRDHHYSADEIFFLNAIIDTVEGELARKPRSPSCLAAWANLRRRQVKAGRLSLLARHLDLLARRIPAR